MYSPHTKGPRETKISWGHMGNLVFWTKSSRPAHVNKKIHHLRLITHADVASFNAAAKRISKADRMQKNGGPKHEISIDFFDVEIEPERERTVKYTLAEPCCPGRGRGCSKR